MFKWLVVILIVITLSITAIFFLKPQKPDAVSSATVVSLKKVQMPKKSKDYEAFQVDGLMKIMVSYSDDFARGGMIETVEGMEALKKEGIKTIVSIVPTPEEKAMAKQFGIKLVNLPFSNEVLAPEDLAVFKSVLEKKEPIYVHCHGGTHRAGVLGMYYRLWSGWKYERALKEFVALGGFPFKDKPLLDVIQKDEVNHGIK